MVELQPPAGMNLSAVDVDEPQKLPAPNGDLPGYIFLWRKTLNHPFWKERRVWSRAEAWTYLLLKANFKPRTFVIGNTTVYCRRGELITSEVALSEIWHWSRKRVRAFLGVLSRERMVAKQGYSKWTSIFIVNYESYQKPGTANNPPEEHQRNIKGTQEKKDEKGKNINTTLPRTKPVADPRVKTLLAFWSKTFQEYTGSPYLMNFDKDGAIAKGLLEVHPPEVLEDLARQFFESEDDFIRKSGYTLGVFASQVNKLAVKNGGPEGSAKEATQAFLKQMDAAQAEAAGVDPGQFRPAFLGGGNS